MPWLRAWVGCKGGVSETCVVACVFGSRAATELGYSNLSNLWAKFLLIRIAPNRHATEALLMPRSGANWDMRISLFVHDEELEREQSVSVVRWEPDGRLSGNRAS